MSVRSVIDTALLQKHWQRGQQRWTAGQCDATLVGMNIFFSGIGGTAIGPLAQIAKQAGHNVAGSDKQDSQYIHYLRAHGMGSIHIGQTAQQLRAAHEQLPIDWLVYSSAVSIEQPYSEELEFCKQHGIKVTKRDEFLNEFIRQHGLKLIAVAGTHGKTTTTAMVIWLFKQLGIPVSYSVGAKLSFGDMGQFDPKGEYFVLETDEFDHNFLAFEPEISLITGVDYDHHEYYPTRQSYEHAFAKFVRQSQQATLWEDDAEKLMLKPAGNLRILNKSKVQKDYRLVGTVNRQNAHLVVEGLAAFGAIDKNRSHHVQLMNHFPGISRRFERISERLFSDYAHTPEKIRGCLKTAFELSRDVVVIHEPLTNRRQHFIKNEYRDLFSGVKKLYWVPSYLAREDPGQHVLTPNELIQFMENKEIAEPALLDDSLAKAIREHIDAGDLVVAISGGGGESLDEWLRKNFTNH